MLKARYDKNDKRDMTRLVLREIWDHALGVIADHSESKTAVDIRFHKDSGMLTLYRNGEPVRRLSDASDIDAFKEAFCDEEGPLCIVVSGLMMYLTDTDTGRFFDAIQWVLNEKGGFLLTPDPESARFFMSVWQAVCAESFIDIMMDTDETRPWRTKLQIDNTMVVDPRWDYDRLCEKASSFLWTHGLGTELVPADRYVPDITVENGICTLSKDRIIEALNTLSYWKIKPLHAAAGNEKQIPGGACSFCSKQRGQTLFLELEGRIDSQSAPVLSGLYEKHRDTCNRVVIECADLQYISSVGLRVLISMAKHCAVSMYGVNEAVGEVLSLTGLDALIDVSSKKIDV